MISISGDVATQLATSSASIIEGLFPLWIILIGVALTFYIARSVISLVPKR